jgi:hypothetical protein
MFCVGSVDKSHRPRQSHRAGPAYTCDWENIARHIKHCSFKNQTLVCGDHCKARHTRVVVALRAPTHSPDKARTAFVYRRSGRVSTQTPNAHSYIACITSVTHGHLHDVALSTTCTCLCLRAARVECGHVHKLGTPVAQVLQNRCI